MKDGSAGQPHIFQGIKVVLIASRLSSIEGMSVMMMLDFSSMFALGDAFGSNRLTRRQSHLATPNRRDSKWDWNR
jgi:hypothetical protein